MKKGFSLVELSIVLIIIGLLVAGVSGGSSLINQAKLNKLIAQYESYNTAVKTFYLDFDGYPGDISNAHDLWGSSCDATASKCNGDADGLIEEGSTTNDVEGVRAWQHLLLADLINENVNGLNSSWERTPGVNIPESIYPGSGFMFMAGNHAWWGLTKGNVMMLGKERASNWNDNAIIPVHDLYNLDRKFDDSNANTGRIMAHLTSGGASYCHTSGTYNLSDSTKVCLAGFNVSVE